MTTKDLDAKLISLIKSCISGDNVTLDVTINFGDSTSFNCYFSLKNTATAAEAVVADLYNYHAPLTNYSYNYSVQCTYELDEFYVIKVVVCKFEPDNTRNSTFYHYNILASEADYNAIKRLAYIRLLQQQNKMTKEHAISMCEYYHMMLDENKSINSIDDL